MNQPSIPQCNPKAAYQSQASEIDSAIARVLRSGRYVLGPEVAAFEAEFASYIGVPHALGVANGTDAITIALKALDIGPGDVVLTVSHTAVATVVAIRTAGADPLFIDVEAETGLMDLTRLEELLALVRNGHAAIPLARIKAIIPVHLYGCGVDMDRLMGIANEYQLAVVEDCAQAHGAQFDGRRVGSFGAFGCFSFYPTKNLGAIGDGGAVVTSDPRLLEKARLQREYGWRNRYISDTEGGNSRLDELQAAVLRVKLSKLDADNNARVAIADTYRELIKHPAIKTPPQSKFIDPVYHQFVIRTQHRDQLKSYLQQQGIGTLVHYPVAIHLQPAYTAASFRIQPLPYTEQWAQDVLSLPMFPQLDVRSVAYVAATINAWNGEAR